MIWWTLAFLWLLAFLAIMGFMMGAKKQNEKRNYSISDCFGELRLGAKRRSMASVEGDNESYRNKRQLPAGRSTIEKAIRRTHSRSQSS